MEAALQDELNTDEDMFQDMEAKEESDVSSIQDFDEIFKEMRQAESEVDGKDNSLFHYNLGIAFQKTGRIDEAIEELKKVLKDPKKRADCFLRLAICSHEKNLTDEAIKYLKKGLGSDNLSELKMIEIEYELAMAYKKKGKKRKALKLFKHIHGINSNFREVRKELA